MGDRVPRLRKSNVVFLVGDIAATMRWYEHLGFKGRAVPASPPHYFGIINHDDVFIMLQQLDSYVKPDVYAKREGGVWNVYIETQDVAALYEGLSRRLGLLSCKLPRTGTTNPGNQSMMRLRNPRPFCVLP